MCFAPYVCTSTNILFDFAGYFTSAGKIHPNCLMWLALVYFHGGVVVHCVDMTQFTYSLVKGHRAVFNVSVKSLAHVSSCTSAKDSLGYSLRSVIANMQTLK